MVYPYDIKGISQHQLMQQRIAYGRLCDLLARPEQLPLRMAQFAAAEAVRSWSGLSSVDESAIKQIAADFSTLYPCAVLRYCGMFLNVGALPETVFLALRKQFGHELQLGYIRLPDLDDCYCAVELVRQGLRFQPTAARYVADPRDARRTLALELPL